MSHYDSGTLAKYNSLADPHLQSYFSSERIQTHLRHAGLITNQGEILSDGEYRSRLAQREHRKHVRHMLAENIVNRAIDMERSRNAEMKRYFETVSKAALVNNIKESRRRHTGGNSLGLMSSSSDMGLLSLNSSWAPSRPRSANCHSDFNDDRSRIPRIQSANNSIDRRVKHSSKPRKRRPHSLQRPKTSQRPRSSTKYPDARSSSPPCQIQMVYYGPHTKVDYDRMVFSDIDEVMVMQQHCGGENLVVFKGFLKPGAEFTFASRRHSDYPFGLSLYVKGLIDSRISTCCEYKHRHGVRLGGDRGHFAIVSVIGSKPCIKCRFAKQAQLKKYAESPKEKQNKREKPLTVSINVSDEPKTKQTPVEIPLRHTSISSDSYSQDFDDDNKPNKKGRDGYTSDSSVEPKQTSKRSSESTPKAAPRALRPIRKDTSDKSDSTYDVTPKKDSTKKTWQVIFHPSQITSGNFRMGSNGSSKRFFLKLSFIVNDDNDETESYEVDMKPFVEHSRSPKPYTIPIKFRNIGKPEQIRLKMISTQDEDDDDDDDDDKDDIKWHLDHIEVIDPETQSHYIFPCKNWIHCFQEKYLQISQERVDNRLPSRSTPSPQQTCQLSAKARPSSNRSSRSTTPTNSPKPSKPYQKPSRQISSDEEEYNQSKPKPFKRSSTTSNNGIKPTRQISSDEEEYNQSKPKPSKRLSTTSNNEIKPSRRVSTDNESNQSIQKTSQKSKISSRSSTPTNPPKPARRKISSDEESEQTTPKVERKLSTPVPTRKDSTQRSSPDSSEHRVRFRVTIYPSKNDDGEFIPTQHSRIFLRLNNHKNEVNVTRKTDQLCPTFQSDEEQTFDVDFNQEKDEPVKTLTIGYVNTQSQAKKWNLKKIVLFNTETKKQTVFLCNETLRRNDADYRAEKTFVAQSEESDREHRSLDTPTNEKAKPSKLSDDDDDDEDKVKTTKPNNKMERKSSFHSMNDNEADYKTIFKQLDPDNELDLGSRPRTPSSPRPKTRRGRSDTIEQDDKDQPNLPPLHLENLTNPSARSNDQDSRLSTANENSKSQFKSMYPTDSEEPEEEEDEKSEHY